MAPLAVKAAIPGVLYISSARKRLLRSMYDGTPVTVAALRQAGHNLSCIRAAISAGYIKHSTPDCKTVVITHKGYKAAGNYGVKHGKS